ncbi:MAG: hypothetical protein H8E44_02255 [Planctomycetes bacterium]|nr:hypothetical protein [Planctomycetota bacterium]MBL7037961.1 hypothetical protein [Pirellulaceae bacterium]
MSVVVTCTCGQSFRAKSELMGQRVRCPVCRAPLQIPHSPVQSDDPLGLDGFDDRSLGVPPAHDSASRSLSAQPTYEPPRKRRRSGKNSKVWMVAGVIVAAVCAGAVVIVVLAALLLPAVRAARETAQKARAAGDYANWREYSSPEGGYLVSMPKSPRVDTQRLPGPKGTMGVVTMIQAGVDFGGRRGACFARHARHRSFAETNSTEQVLDSAAQASVDRVNGRMIVNRSATMAGIQGKEIEYEGTVQGISFTARSRCIIVNGTFYELMWISERGRIPENDVRHFFDSFRLR